MGFFFYLATAIVGLPALMVFPAVLPHVLTWIMNRRRIKGKVGAANIKFEWPGTAARLSVSTAPLNPL
jgi:hypothetical protein